MEDITLTPAAVKRLQELATQESSNSLYLRITVEGGGCSGFQYQFSLDHQAGAQDLVFQEKDARVVIDDISFGLLKGSTVDYKSDLTGSAFQITNPNASAGCGCGNSFSI